MSGVRWFRRVPTEPILEIVREYVDTEEDLSKLTFENQTDGPLKVLCERAGVKRDSIEKAGRQATMDFDTADRLLCAMDCVHLWRGPLLEIYLGVVLCEDEKKRINNARQKAYAQKKRDKIKRDREKDAERKRIAYHKNDDRKVYMREYMKNRREKAA